MYKVKDPFAHLLRKEDSRALKVISSIVGQEVKSLSDVGKPLGRGSIWFREPRFVKSRAVGLRGLLQGDGFINLRKHPFNEAAKTDGDFVFVFDDSSAMGSADSLWMIRFSHDPGKIVNDFASGKAEGMICIRPASSGGFIVAVQAKRLKSMINNSLND